MRLYKTEKAASALIMAPRSRISFTILVIAVSALADGLTISIPAGNPSDLQDYLCNGSLPSNTTLQLQQGVHVISREGYCTVKVNVHLTGAGVRETTINCTSKWELRFLEAQNIVIEGITFVNCGLDDVLNFRDTHSITVRNLSFVNISGYGVHVYDSITVTMSDVYFSGCAIDRTCVGASFSCYDNAMLVTIKRCSFVDLGDGDSYNYRYDHAAGLELLEDVVADVRDCSFVRNRGTGLLAFDSKVTIFNCSFSGNLARRGAALNAGSVGFFNVTGSRFYNNSAYAGAAILISGRQYQSTDNTKLMVNNCDFQNNQAQVGGGIYTFDLMSHVVLSASTFMYNSASIGAAIYASDEHNSYGERSYSVSLIDVAVIQNKCSPCTNVTKGAVVYYNEIDYLNISGSYEIGSQFIGNLPQGTVEGIGANLHLSGRVSFQNNSGENGAAIFLTNDAHLYFHSNCIVNFSDNVATGYGGAIYIEGDQSIPTYNLTHCAIHFIDGEEYSILFRGNRANIAGNSIYATPIYECLLQSQSIPTIYPAKQSDYDPFYTMHNSNSDQILSFPVKLDMCGCNYGSKQFGTNSSVISAYPGATLQCNASLTDSAGNLSPSVVFAQVVTGENHASLDVKLAPQQEVQWIGNNCTAIEYKMYGPQNTSAFLQLSSKPGRNLQTFQMALNMCEAGFSLQTDSRYLLQCECSKFLSQSGVTCDIDQGTVTRDGLQWIGLYSDGNEAIATTCPLRYCNVHVAHLRVGHPSDICAGQRVGVLCGQCPDGLSVVFGSAECQKCSDLWLLTILLYAIIGALLVAALFLFNITVTSGFLYGLIFYANILVVNGTVFFSQSNLMPLEIVVSLINLNLGFPVCFYDGMDDLAKTGLQFVFPAYLLLISYTIVITSKYCLNWSMANEDSFVHRIRQSVGKRAVNVLATLVYLSYCKILRTVIDIFTFAVVYVQNNNAVKVWFYDGTTEYLSGSHALLFVIAMVAFIFLFLYTFALTVIPIVDTFSEKYTFCKWLHRKGKVHLLKPVNDAYYSPFKGRWRIWLGARLWLVVILYSLGPFLGPQNPSLLLLIHAILIMIFTIIQIHIMPFDESSNGVWVIHKGCCIYMRHLLDLFYLLNYTLLALIVSYLLTKDTAPLQVIVGVFVGLFVFAFCCTIIYHAIDVCRRRNVTPLNLSDTLHRTADQIPLASSLHVDYNSDDLREPLLEECSKVEPTQ